MRRTTRHCCNNWRRFKWINNELNKYLNVLQDKNLKSDFSNLLKQWETQTNTWAWVKFLLWMYPLVLFSVFITPHLVDFRTFCPCGTSWHHGRGVTDHKKIPSTSFPIFFFVWGWTCSSSRKNLSAAVELATPWPPSSVIKSWETAFPFQDLLPDAHVDLFTMWWFLCK